MTDAVVNYFVDGCYQLAAMKPIAVEHVDKMIETFYTWPGNAVGGQLHIVLDDSNLHNRSINSCIKTAKEKGDRAAAALGAVLLKMPYRDRLKLSCVCDCGCMAADEPCDDEACGCAEKGT